MNADIRKRAIRIILPIFLFFTLFYVGFCIVQKPAEQRILVGQELKLQMNVPDRLLNAMNISVIPQEGLKLRYKGTPLKGKVIKFNSFSDEWPVASTTGTANVQLRILGIIPVRNMIVNVIPQYEVVPGGQSIGVMLQTKGILVVGYSPVETKNGVVSPAKDTGVRMGDILISTNGQSVNDEETMARIIDSYGKKQKKVILKVRRGEDLYEFRVKPEFCTQTQRYRIGLYIRDNAAGVGTLTFYDPQSRKYGALGHVVSNGAGGQKIDIKNGKIVESVIQGIQPGKKGKPGEKIGMFMPGQGLSGIIEKNTFCGIFGRLTTIPKNDLTKRVPIALTSQIHKGPAKIRTVVNGNRIEEFDIEIIKVMPYQEESGKGLVIKITDKELLERTGGIIQGMSGSPILQEGRLVGAVTHVFINEPTQGYGILAEWMLLESGLSVKKQHNKEVSVGNATYLLSRVC